MDDRQPREKGFQVDDLVFYYPQGHESHFQQGHPERPERVEAIREALTTAGLWQKYPCIDPIPLPRNVLESIHAPSLLAKCEQISKSGGLYDMDTYLTPSTWDLSQESAGGAVAVAQAVWEGSARSGFALTRPPGHHATPSQAMGFCLLNNVALAAEYLLQATTVEKLAIVDLDLHHGNGTQDIFYRRGDVFFISTHQSPLYPGTGDLWETGEGPGEMATANFPLPPFSGDLAFKTVMEELILPLLDKKSPQMLLVSYGFDPHFRDPLGNLLLSAPGYRDLIADLVGWAGTHCGGRIALFLEGGYDLSAARACSLAVVSALLDIPWEDIVGFVDKDAAGPSLSRESTAWQPMVRRARELWGLA